MTEYDYSISQFHTSLWQFVVTLYCEPSPKTMNRKIGDFTLNHLTASHNNICYFYHLTNELSGYLAVMAVGEITVIIMRVYIFKDFSNFSISKTPFHQMIIFL